MSEIRNLTRNGETFYPLTCTDAVVDRDGNPVEIINDIFDISEYNASGTPPVLAKYASLDLALAAVPETKRKGGMTIRYVQTSDNKYVQYRCIVDEFTTDVTKWEQDAQIVFSGSDGNKSISFVDESGNCAMQVKDGHVKTKNFDSRNAVTKDYTDDKVKEEVGFSEIRMRTIIEEKTAEVDKGDDGIESLSLVDKESNCVAQFKEGHIKTKEFDSRNAVIKDDLDNHDDAISIIDDKENCIAQFKEGHIKTKEFDSRKVEKSPEIVLPEEITAVVGDTTVVVKVINQLSSQSPAKNILVVGASTYTSGTIVGEVNRRFSSDSGDGTPANPTGLNITGINFIGRREVAGIHQEANGGYKWSTYATDAFKAVRFYVSGASAINLDAIYRIDGVPESSSYSFTVVEVNITDGTGNILCEVYGGYVYESLPASGTLIKISGTGDDEIAYTNYQFEDGNPFWYDGGLDFSHYSDVYCGGADIDVLYTDLGHNGLRSRNDVDTAIENYVISFIRQYHIDYPNGKFILGTPHLGSPNGGYASIGYANARQNWYNISDVAWYLLGKYKQIAADAEFSSYVSLSESIVEFDCENGYPEGNKAVDNRVSKTEVIQRNQIHPTEDGKKMISDSIYRKISKLFN